MLSKRDNFCIGIAALAAGTGGTYNTAAISYSIDGRGFAKAATTNTATFATAGVGFVGNLGNNQQSVFFVVINAAGTLTTLQSAIYVAPTGAGYVSLAVEWPDPVLQAVIGAIHISCSAAQTFTVGTTVPGTANTAVFYNSTGDYGKAIII
jgi:hypothetical protein